MTVDDLLAEARSVLPHRPGPIEALAAQTKGALLVDIRGDDQRRSRTVKSRRTISQNPWAPAQGCAKPPVRPCRELSVPTSATAASRRLRIAAARRLAMAGLVSTHHMIYVIHRPAS
jgi:hypothetical protein